MQLGVSPKTLEPQAASNICLRKKNTMTDEVSDATRLARQIFDGL
jgi:hypothetical protein